MLNFLAMLDPWNLAQIVLGVGMLVFVHELGHFLACRLAGVGVEVFSLGFGPALFSLKRGDTEYKISALPIGGYVKWVGADEFGDDAYANPRSFQSASFRGKLLIITGGVLMNFIFGFCVFWIAFVTGVDSTVPEVGLLDKHSPAYQAGLRPGDRVLSIDGMRVYRYEELRMEIAVGGEKPHELKVQRGDETLAFTVTPVRDSGMPLLSTIGLEPSCSTTIAGYYESDEFKYPFEGTAATIVALNGQGVADWNALQAALDAHIAAHPEAGDVTLSVGLEDGRTEELAVPLRGRRQFGVEMVAQDQNVVKNVMPDSHAHRAGILANDKIVECNGVPIRAVEDLRKILTEAGGNNFKFVVERDGQSLAIDAVIAPVKGLPLFPAVKSRYLTLGPLAAMRTAWTESVGVYKQIKLFFLKLFSAQAKEASQQIGGPIGIFHITYKIAEQGFGKLMLILAMISINLGIVNLLPIPILDGGTLMFVLAEKVKGSPVRREVQETALYLGLFIIIAIFIFATYNDISNIGKF